MKTQENCEQTIDIISSVQNEPKVFRKNYIFHEIFLCVCVCKYYLINFFSTQPLLLSSKLSNSHSRSHARRQQDFHF